MVASRGEDSPVSGVTLFGSVAAIAASGEPRAADGRTCASRWFC